MPGKPLDVPDCAISMKSQPGATKRVLPNPERKVKRFNQLRD
jgi:hypothetical protein